MKTWILLSALFLVNCGSSSTPTASTKQIKVTVNHRPAAAEQASLLQGLGGMLEYYITLDIEGTRYDLVADTGSSNLIVAGFSTNKPKSGGIFPLSYGGGTSIEVQNYLVPLTLSDGDEASTYNVGVIKTCKAKCSNTFPRIVGLAYSGVEGDPSVKTFMDHLVEIKKPALSNEFSMLLCGFKDDGSHNGKTNILFGGIEPGVTLAGSDYTPIIEKSWYVVNATEIMIDGVLMGGKFNSPIPTKEVPCANLNGLIGTNNCTILDSGTTVNQVPTKIHQAIVSNLASRVGLEKGDPFWDPVASPQIVKRACSTLRKDGLPTVDVHIGDLIVKIPSKSYFKSVGGGDCMFGFGTTNLGSSNFKILGQVTMENQYVHFDRKNNRIGFKQALDLCGN